MPYTIAIFAHRKPNTTPQQFKHHYETSHIPLVQSLAGDKFPISHVRNYIQRAPSETAATDTSNTAHPAVALVGRPEDFDYDAVAFLKFEDEAHFQAFFGVVSQTENQARIAADEELFLERGRMRVVVVDQVAVTGRA